MTVQPFNPANLFSEARTYAVTARQQVASMTSVEQKDGRKQQRQTVVQQMYNDGPGNSCRS